MASSDLSPAPYAIAVIRPGCKPGEEANMQEPRHVVASIETSATLPEGNEERFTGYGVMGVPFSSGHVLCLRRFPIASIGRGYTSVWHRDPGGCWTFIQDVPPRSGCSRYFGSAVDRSLVQDIRIEWSSAWSFSVDTRGEHPVRWQVRLSRTRLSDLMNAAAGCLPDALWRSEALLRAIGKVGSLILGAGRMSLVGDVPNGQRFRANPKRLWVVEASRADICGRDVGEMAPLAEQARLGDFWIPQRGRFFTGSSFLEPFDEARHISATSRAEGRSERCAACA
jgi:hypothetical protein